MVQIMKSLSKKSINDIFGERMILEVFVNEKQKEETGLIREDSQESV